VKIAESKSFVVADIPGLIEGAAEGAGLGIRFLKHLVRTRLLLHLVDVAPYDGTSPVDSVRTIAGELTKFSETLAERERWLVLNKTDMLAEDEREAVCRQIAQELGWTGPVFRISALTGDGTRELSQAVMQWIERRAEEEAEHPQAAERESALRQRMDDEAREQIEAIKQTRRTARTNEQDEDDDEDDDGPEVVYAPE
jgi:GTP-binding protein